MDYSTKVRMWGNSLGVIIPRRLARSINVGSGSEVVFSQKENALLIEPVKKDLTLDELCDRVTKSNRHDQVVFERNVAG